MNQNKKIWYLYILECADGTLYTGITLDLERRLGEHNDGEGARYTRARLPVKMVYHMEVADRSSASKLEYRVKKMPRRKKIEIISGIRHLRACVADLEL